MPRLNPKKMRYKNLSKKAQRAQDFSYTDRNDGYDWASQLFEKLTGRSYKTFFFKAIGATLYRKKKVEKFNKFKPNKRWKN